MTEGHQRRFGRTSEADVDLLTYGGYLKLPGLLSLQQLLSDPPVHDELHQGGNADRCRGHDREGKPGVA